MKTILQEESACGCMLPPQSGRPFQLRQTKARHSPEDRIILIDFLETLL